MHPKPDYLNIVTRSVTASIFFLTTSGGLTAFSHFAEQPLIIVPAVIIGAFGMMKAHDEYKTEMIFYRTAAEDELRHREWRRQQQHEEFIREHENSRNNRS